MQQDRTKIIFFVDVPQKDVARIVGAKGVNINGIQENCGCFIRSPPRDVEPHDDGTVSFQLRGKPFNCFKAAEMIQETLGVEIPIPFSAIEVNLGSPSDVALLIGPSGGSIRAIMKECNVKIITRPRNEKSDLIVIEGLPRDVKRAFDLVFETVENAKKEKDGGYRSSRDRERQKSPTKSETTNPKSNNNSNIKNSTNNNNNNNNNNNSNNNNSSSNNGDGAARQWGAPKQPKFAADAKETQGQEREEEEREMTFPSNMTGLLFGREGATIKNVKRRSKASIFVDPKTCIIRIKGSSSACDLAQKMIKEILERKPKEKKKDVEQERKEKENVEKKDKMENNEEPQENDQPEEDK